MAIFVWPQTQCALCGITIDLYSLTTIFKTHKKNKQLSLCCSFCFLKIYDVSACTWDGEVSWSPSMI
jgi:hypothetical protein